MKYFKVTNLITGEGYYTSSSLPTESTAHLMMSEHLDTKFKYRIEEVSSREYFRSKNGLFAAARTFDVDEDHEDYCDEIYNIG